jgi:hypothetical protein
MVPKFAGNLFKAAAYVVGEKAGGISFGKYPRSIRA